MTSILTLILSYLFISHFMYSQTHLITHLLQCQNSVTITAVAINMVCPSSPTRSSIGFSMNLTPINVLCSHKYTQQLRLVLRMQSIYPKTTLTNNQCITSDWVNGRSEVRPMCTERMTSRSDWMTDWLTDFFDQIVHFICFLSNNLTYITVLMPMICWNSCRRHPTVRARRTWGIDSIFHSTQPDSTQAMSYACTQSGTL